jgi:hypothetical protein
VKPIRTLEYVVMNMRTDEVECHVTFFDDTREVFYEEDDLERVKMQLWKQFKPGTRITV